MCQDETALVENMRVDNCFFDTRVRTGNRWGNGGPILLTAVPQAADHTAPQMPARKTDCAIRIVHLNGITCTGENAMGIVGVKGNIREVPFSHIDYTRKPAGNLPLKGHAFDLAPSCVVCEAPEDCGLKTTGAKEVVLEHVDTRSRQIIQEEDV